MGVERGEAKAEGSYGVLESLVAGVGDVLAPYGGA